jgi:hypothetical protein
VRRAENRTQESGGEVAYLGARHALAGYQVKIMRTFLLPNLRAIWNRPWHFLHCATAADLGALLQTVLGADVRPAADLGALLQTVLGADVRVSLYHDAPQRKGRMGTNQFCGGPTQQANSRSVG